MRDIADRLKILITERLGVDEATVTPDASFIDDLGADSLDLVDLMTSLEEEFGLELGETEMECIHTVKDAAAVASANIVSPPSGGTISP